MAVERRKYTEEFKREAVRLMETSGKAIAEMARDLGINDNNLYRWRGVYGSPRVHAALRQQGIRCSRKRVARLMREHGIHSRRRPKRRVHTTDSQHHRPVAPNLLKRDFSADAPNQKWVGDIVGIWTDEGWLYLAGLLDTYSRFIVGCAMSCYRDEALVTDALRMALAGREVPEDTALI